MNFELEGILVLKEDAQDISASFKKREFVIEVINERNSDWNDFIKFQLTQDRCNLIDNVNVNDEVKVSFNIRGNKWERDGKVNYFTNLDAWRIEKYQADQSAMDSTPPPSLDDLPPEPDEPDDLPF